MPETKLKPGSVVRLTCGSPDMTVIAVTENGAKCAWFPTDESLPATAEFPVAALEEQDA